MWACVHFNGKAAGAKYRKSESPRVLVFFLPRFRPRRFDPNPFDDGLEFFPVTSILNGRNRITDTVGLARRSSLNFQRLPPFTRNTPYITEMRELALARQPPPCFHFRPRARIWPLLCPQMSVIKIAAYREVTR